jgi:hypothetical protein
LGIPKLDSGTGSEQAAATHKLLVDWDLSENIVGLSFDTTASNTGVTNGACVLLEEKIGKPLLRLACRHHVMELMAAAVFSVEFENSTGIVTQ